MDYKKAINKALSHAAITKKELAKEFDLSDNYIYDCCTGQKRPGLIFLENLAVLCEVNLSTLIRWGEE